MKRDPADAVLFPTIVNTDRPTLNGQPIFPEFWFLDEIEVLNKLCDMADAIYKDALEKTLEDK